MHARRRQLVLMMLAAMAPMAALAQDAPVRLRGSIESLSATQLVLRERSGERVELAIPGNVVVTEIYPVTLAAIRAGDFVGVGAMPQADGTQRAIAVTVFPEAMRGTGEGHRPFDFMPQSTMTNATVAEVAAAPDGQRLQLRYKDDQKTIVVPPGTPIVSLRPGDRSLLAAGSAVSVTALQVSGKPTALRISAGRNGFAPPY